MSNRKTEILDGARFVLGFDTEDDSADADTYGISLIQSVPRLSPGLGDLDINHHNIIEVYGNEKLRDSILNYLQQNEDPTFKFKVGQVVRKVGSYGGPGEVRVAFKVNGQSRYVVSHTLEGGHGLFLHIYGDKELEDGTPSPDNN